MPKTAVIQLVSGDQLQPNLEIIDQQVTRAAAQGAVLAVLPENPALFSLTRAQAIGGKEYHASGPIRSYLSRLARRHRIWLVVGSIPIQEPDEAPRIRAACLVINDQGETVARYDKIHLFDATVADAQGSYRESAAIAPGKRAVTVDTPIGRLGLSICYDLRFPELYRELRAQGATVFTVPSAFTQTTGAAHWETLLRARAIENQCYVLAANQGGQHSAERETHGHSMIIDPWGRILEQWRSGVGVIVGDVEPARVAEIRRQMPVWDHRRLPARREN